MKNQKVSSTSVGMSIPMFSAFAFAITTWQTAVIITAIMLAVVIPMLIREVIQARRESRKALTVYDYLVALAIVQRAYEAGGISRESFIKGDLFIRRLINMTDEYNNQVLGIVVRTRQAVPAGWVEAG